MEVRVRERLIGALVLVAIIVLLVPAVLKGPDRSRTELSDQPTRTVIVPLLVGEAPAGDEILMPEPEPPAPSAELQSAAIAPENRPPAAPVAPAETAGRPPVAMDTAAWAVQLGAFSTRAKAEGLVADLRKRGYAAFVLEYRASGKLLHRVRVGPEQDRERAVAIAERLRKDGFQPVVAPHP
jgi:DedD protein